MLVPPLSWLSFPRWLANGLELGWLIDPDARAVEVFRPGREPETACGADCPVADGLTADGPVAGFALDLALIRGE